MDTISTSDHDKMYALLIYGPYIKYYALFILNNVPTDFIVFEVIGEFKAA